MLAPCLPAKPCFAVPKGGLCGSALFTVRPWPKSTLTTSPIVSKFPHVKGEGIRQDPAKGAVCLPEVGLCFGTGMSYYKALGLNKEPFSTSPDPSFFFHSREHKAALCRLQIAISLKRGMSVILGDIGTGKTTLSRKLARELSEDPDVIFNLILNPYFRTEKQFLSRLARLFHIKVSSRATGLDYMEAIERYLFHTGVEERKTVVLLIDEAQILPDFVFEVLRILLNYETNEYKILQLVLVGQMELMPRIGGMSNFWDRIAMKYVLNPLCEDEVRDMVDYRLREAGYTGAAPLFTDEAIRTILKESGGYPRKLTLYCHNCLEHLVMYGKKIVEGDVARRVVDEDVKPVHSEADGSVAQVSPFVVRRDGDTGKMPAPRQAETQEEDLAPKLPFEVRGRPRKVANAGSDAEPAEEPVYDIKDHGLRVIGRR